MTKSGEETTLKGECNSTPDSVYSFNKSITISHSINVADSNKLEIKMGYEDDAQLEFYQMIFVMKGSIRLNKGGNFADDLEIGAQQHNLFKVTLKFNRMLMSSFKDEVVCINLSKEFLRRYIPVEHQAYRKLMLQNDSGKPVVLSSLNLPITPEISSVLRRLSTLNNADFHEQLLLESKVIELLALQISQFDQAQNNILPTQLKQTDMEKMFEAREILIQNTGEQLSLKSLALKVGTNEFNLKRDFKTLFGNTVYGYLNEYKMEQAKSMVIENDLTIAEISEKVGYKHATHFTSAFKKYFGLLPNKLRSGKLSLLLFTDELMVLFENFGLLT
ncbi:AraC family transcriptional regulator [Pedobacter aquatilis]|uniref:helix-turn-helix transcriptional regulator n=1 Tax=Pedobacter aquatilis TaxID=351343 RepID=UPI0025B3433D|nr:AraC family transcriptional regulator [Pedobacter aquatilis]MDN3587865.1 AraC family transcriptional regulator [Pedobacter aquatilis]